MESLGSPKARRGAAALIVALVLLAHVAGATTLAWVRMPQSDEGHFANAGYELAYHQRLAMPMWTAWVSSLDRHMYVQMPLYYVQLAPWIRLFGFDLRTVRLNSVLWGVVFLMAWYVTVHRVSQDRFTALLGVALIGLHYDVMNMTSARYDVMCAALSAAGVASYLAWREEHLGRAVLVGNAALAAALLTHPFGIFGLLGFVLFFAVLDIRRLSWSVALAAAVPYVVGFGAWGLYILQAPTEFRDQIAANAQGRLAALSQPVDLLIREIRERYLIRYAGWRSDVPLMMRMKILFLLAYVAGVLGCLLTPRLRRDRRVMALVLWGALSFALLAVADSHRWYIYLLHVIPIFVAVLATWSGALVKRGSGFRYLVLTAMVGWVLFSAATVIFRARLDDFDQLYRPTLSYLQKHVHDGQLVFAGGEFGPGLGFRKHVLDDMAFHGETMPDWIVFDKAHDERMEYWARAQPEQYRHMQERLAGYELVLDNRQPYNYYRVYRRAGR